MPLNGKTKRDVLVEFRHAEILQAARRVFADKGFSDASVDEIAQAAGVAKGTVYLYYPSKRDIYWEALKGGLVALCEVLETAVRAADSTENKIRAFMRTKMLFFEEHRDFFKIYHAEFVNAGAQPGCFERDLKVFHVRQMRLLTDAIEDGMRRRSIRKLPADETAFAILHLTRGVITQRLLGLSRSGIEEAISLLFDLTWKGLAGK